MTDILATVRFQQTTSLPKDVVENNFAFQTPTPVTPAHFTTMDTALENFYNFSDPVVIAPVGEFISGVILRGASAMEVRYYDISGSLGVGLRHGSPVHTSFLGFTVASGNPVNLPNQEAVVLSFRSGTVSGAGPGVAAAIPTGDQAQDEGAPATHPGFTRPLERLTGRIYVGPLNVSSVTGTTTNEPRVSVTLRQALIAAAKKMIVDLGIALFWSIWSRANSALVSVNNGWVDDRFDAQRRRESPATGRLLFP